MPRIIALQPTETTVVDLGYFSWGLGIDATTLETVEGRIPCFSLVWRYVPHQLGTFRPIDSAFLPLTGPAMTPLVRLEVDFEKDLTTEMLKPVTTVTLTRGNVEDDVKRMTEAYTLFRNGRPSLERLEKCIADSTTIVRAYWLVRGWISEGMKAEKRLPVLQTELVLLP
jgi:hypothetical protein